MSSDGETAAKVVIGISFGNSYSSVANTSDEGKAQVIANEEGGAFAGIVVRWSARR